MGTHGEAESSYIIRVDIRKRLQKTDGSDVITEHLLGPDDISGEKVVIYFTLTFVHPGLQCLDGILSCPGIQSPVRDIRKVFLVRIIKFRPPLGFRIRAFSPIKSIGDKHYITLSGNRVSQPDSVEILVDPLS